MNVLGLYAHPGHTKGAPDMARVLAVYAHPDDEIGAAGYLARLAQEGHEVTVAALGTGVGARGERGAAAMAADDTRRAEMTHAVRSVLHATAQWCALPLATQPRDNEFDACPLLFLVQQVENLIEHVAPALVLTHHAGDLNVDHQRVHQAVVTATRPLPGSPVQEVLAGEVPSSTQWAYGGAYVPFTPTVFVDISSTLEQKLAALRCYESEARAWPHPRSPEAVEARARCWGSVIGRAAAEPFMLVRSVR